MARREALDVDLVDDRLVPRSAQWPVGAPGEGGVDDERLRHAGRAVAPVHRQVGVGVADLVAEQRVAPAHGAVDGAGVGVEEQLGRVEAVTGGRLPWPLHPVAVAETRPRLRHVDVPDAFRPLGHGHPRLAVAVEHAQLDGGRVLGEEGEVDARPLAHRTRPGSWSHALTYCDSCASANSTWPGGSGGLSRRLGRRGRHARRPRARAAPRAICPA